MRLAPEGLPAQARQVALGPWMILCFARSLAGRLSVHAQQIVSQMAIDRVLSGEPIVREPPGM
jgi:hypothetical protein